jgi:glycosyltransferase involved in cell wall biosynthesis
MEKILFITNRLFIDEQAPEGGVSYCTKDFISLLKTRYEVVLFPVSFNQSFLYRLTSKLGIAVFEDYAPQDVAASLFKTITENSIKKVFINLSTALSFSKIISEELGSAIKIILCSHGIEGGDMLHNAVRSNRPLSWFQQLTSSYKLGGTLKKELEFRKNYIDLVLTVSEIEVSIEKWMGARKVFFVPRIFSKDFISWIPVKGRLGFVGDLNHFPNYYGLLQLCEAISQKEGRSPISIKVVGKESKNLDALLSKYSFVQSLGYLENDELQSEAATWAYYLNLVFYYSKGVSTKLAKGMNWGLPVISTEAGNRGYIFKQGGVVTCSDAKDMADTIMARVFDLDIVANDRNEVIKAVESFNDLNNIMSELYPLIEDL